VNCEKPFNAEPPPELLIEAGLTTPIELHYKRNHLPVPVITAADYRLEVATDAGSVRSFTLSELQDTAKFPRHSVLSTVQCAGNRRSELAAVKPIKGLDWGPGAISTAEWSGVLLRDVVSHSLLPLLLLLLLLLPLLFWSAYN
jgi:sulfite oxidase